MALKKKENPDNHTRQSHLHPHVWSLVWYNGMYAFQNSSTFKVSVHTRFQKSLGQ